MSFFDAILADPQNQVIAGLAASFALQAIGRAIPNDKKGALGVVRKVAKFGGLYIDNRVTQGKSVADVAEDVLTNTVSRSPNGKFVARRNHEAL